jgi:hypothetical protein
VKFFAQPARSRHRLVYLVGAVVSIALSLLLLAGRAGADQVYWINVNSVSYSQLDDTAGGYLSSSVSAIRNGMGTAIDTANGRIYVAQRATDEIAWFSLDGVDRGIVKTAPGTVENPTNIAIDPEAQTLYWANATNPGSIGYVDVNESAGGILAKPGSSEATVKDPTRLAIDTRHHRVYWWNELSDEFSWITTDGMLSGNLLTPGFTVAGTEGMGGIAVEPYSTPEELYFIDDEAEKIFHTDPLLGGKPEEVYEAIGKTNFTEPIGLAFDGSLNRFYWANSTIDSNPDKAIGTATLFGQPSTISVFPVAPIHNPVFASILKAPESLAEPLLAVSGASMGCTLGEWEGDHPGASVYAGPTSFGYQWRKGSVAIPGANAATFTAEESGTYSCEVIAVNAAGEVGAKSKSTTISFPKPKTTTPPAETTKPAATKPAPAPKVATVTAKLASSKPAKAKAGGTAVISVDLTNSGNATSGAVKVCGSLAKQAKKGLVAPKCVTVGSVTAGKTSVAQLAVKTRSSARGTYKVAVAVSGATTASLTAKVQVAGAKKVKRRK